ncbi:MAG: hypothetical protein HY451_00895 [Parcubacteria group bacterium]|nr:hypothetical protein [Parcubacteria group bacterium]
MTKNLIILFIAVFAGVFLGMIFLTDWLGKEEPATNQVSQIEEEGAGPTAEELNIGISSASRIYSSLVAQFEGKRIQFDDNCQMIPPSITYKNGTRIMLDNRAGQSRVIVIDNNQFIFPAYSYKLVTLRSRNLPYTVKINKCDDLVNVGQILIQR